MLKDSVIQKINEEALKDVNEYEQKKKLLAEAKTKIEMLEYEVYRSKQKATTSLKKLKKALTMKSDPKNGLSIV